MVRLPCQRKFYNYSSQRVNDKRWIPNSTMEEYCWQAWQNAGENPPNRINLLKNEFRVWIHSPSSLLQ
ncbi:hypothetical protein NC652_024922 [Populus alba x Populus x berolinensis]|nr:hypothetical protein NC652_024922 [Populus alba x Populus x berolinensis]